MRTRASRNTLRLMVSLLLLLLTVQSLFAQYSNRRRFPSEWIEVDSPIEDNLHLIHFHDNNRGWILSDSSGVLLGTQDGGQTWVIEDSLAPGYYEVLTTTDDGNLWVAGDQGHLLVRPVNGNEFRERGALRGDLALYDLMAVYDLVDSTDFKLFAGGVRLVNGQMKPWLGRSDTRGRSWERMGDEFSGRYISGLAQSPLGFLYVASEGNIYTSLTGSPNTWISIFGPTGQEQFAIRDMVIDPGADGGTMFGLATGHDGLVLATFNGGRNWLRIQPFTTNRMRSALVLGTQVGWVVGDATNDGGVCWRTRDRAANWQLVRLPYDEISLHDIAATDRAMFAVGTGGTIYTMPR
ncbi:hypothetical protein KQI63_10740 [bacterium]|nr:hypothetical protein [bacterium]